MSGGGGGGRIHTFIAAKNTFSTQSWPLKGPAAADLIPN